MKSRFANPVAAKPPPGKWPRAAQSQITAGGVIPALPRGVQSASALPFAARIFLPATAAVFALSLPALAADNDATLRFVVPRGITSFIVDLATSTQQLCFTFLNDNAAAEGKLSIAVSNERRSNDSKWKTVAGAVSFRHKRRLDLSLVGVEAKYVKLTFQVPPSELRFR